MLKKNEGITKLPVRAVGSIKHHRSWAIYGRSGTGKTTFAGTFPAPILYLDVRDKGTESVSDVEDMYVMAVEDFEDLDDAYEYLSKNPAEYKTVVIDTVSQLQQLALEYVVRSKKKANRIGDWGSLTRQEWGDASALMKERITRFRDLPMEVAFIAQERTNQENDDGGSEELLMPEVGPALMKSVAANLNASVSIIANSFIRIRRRTVAKNGGKKDEKEEMIYCLRLGPHPIYVTKLRKPRHIEPPPWLEDPTHEDVVSILEGKE